MTSVINSASAVNNLSILCNANKASIATNASSASINYSAYNASIATNSSIVYNASNASTANNASSASITNIARSPQLMTQANIVITPQPRNLLQELKTNVVSTVNLGCRLDLKKIALSARNAEYNPKRLQAVIMRIRDPRTTALIFASGKVVVTGAKDEATSKLAARKYARIMQKLGFNAKSLDMKIINILGSCDVKFSIRLESLHLVHGNFGSYEPELYPALIYRMEKPRVVLHIFPSGKVVLAGAKTRQEIYEAFKNIYPILKQFQVNSDRLYVTN